MLEGIRREHANLSVLDNPGRIAPTGLNVAIRAARGDVIVRVDGHTEVAAGLRSAVRRSAGPQRGRQCRRAG